MAQLGRWMRSAGVAAILLLWRASATAPSELSADLAVGERLFAEARFAHAPAATSCRTCHSPASAGAFVDRVARSAVPPREDGQATTPRNSPSLLEALGEGATGLLHYDGEFASAEDLVVETFLGRNFGWLPGERATALQHFAGVIRSDETYVAALRELDVGRAADEQLVRVCADRVVAYLRSLRFVRDAQGRHNGSAYDAFLVANRLPRAPAPDETPPQYARRLGAALMALLAPRFVDERGRGFGETELQGLRIFFRAALGRAQSDGAGNCAECHVPPRFTDFKFHNTGVTQDDYDAQHGAGAFAALVVPTLAQREADPARWLPATPQHSSARGELRAPAERAAPGRADLGLWNVYANPDFPAPQAAIARVLDPSEATDREELLARSLARFKTPTVRNLGPTAPYFHTGRTTTVDDAVRFYRRMSDLARRGQMRNAPPEFFAIRLDDADVAPLVAFLRALNEASATSR